MKMPKNDRQVVSQLANANYSDWITGLREILQRPESPLSFKNGIWTVVQRKEMWQSFGSIVFDEHLERFKNIVVDVLKEKDPQFELTPEKRYMANIEGKVLRHSHSLRKGLAETLALLGSEPETLKHCSRGKAEAIANYCIREIFRDSDWALWASLNNLLPTLAEAAPEEFLNAVEKTLLKKPCPFDEIFSQESTGIFGNNYMTGLLWALETLAWDEKYLVQVTIILGKLALHDTKGNWGNRPDNSLTTIFLPWLPQTIASIEKRKAAIKTLQKECPVIAWKLLLNLLPNQHQSSSGSRKPEWRKIIPDDWEKGVTNKEYWEQASSYADIAVGMVKGDFAKLSEVIDNLDNLPEPVLNKLLEYLSSSEIINSPEDERTSLWNVLLHFVLKHKQFKDAEWALPAEQVEKIEQIANQLAPKKPQNLYKRLFIENESSLYDNFDWEEQSKKLEILRQNAIRKIIEQGKLEAILQFAEIVESPYKVGFSLAFVADDSTDTIILPAMLENENKKLELLVKGFIWGRYCKKGQEWANQIDTSSWLDSQKGKFLICLPFTEETWNLAEIILGSNEDKYWKAVDVQPFRAENLDLAVDKLMKYNRPKAAVRCAFAKLHLKKTFNKKQIVKALLNYLSSEEISYNIDGYEITELIKYLQDDPETNREDLFNVEWAFLTLLTAPGKTASPKLLEQKLASEPEFFCEAIRFLYKSKKDSKSKKETTEQQKNIASNLWSLFREWRILPGTNENGEFSENDFKSWLKAVKIKCEETGHLEVAMHTIGNVLIHYINDPSGLWIHKALAEALNAEDAEEIRRGFYLGIVNSRGAHFVDPTGKPEKELAAKYRKQAEEVENALYHRFAITLRSLADSYEEEAKRIIEERKDGRI